MTHTASKIGMTAFALFLSQNILSAADLTWDGGAGGSFNWSDDANWGGSTLSDGDNIAFSGSTGTTNVNNTTGLSLGSITLGGSNVWTVGSATSASANGISLSDGLSITGTGSVNFGSNVTLTAEQTISNTSTNYRTLNFTNSMTFDIGSFDTVFHTDATATNPTKIHFDYGNTLKGSGNITKTGNGVLEFRGNGAGSPYTDFTGDILISAGTIRSDQAGTLGSVTGTTTVADGATLLIQGGGSVVEFITASGEGVYYASDKVQRGALAFWSNSTLSRTMTLGGASTDLGFRHAGTIARIDAGLVELSAGSEVVKVGSYSNPSAGFLRFSGDDVTYTGTTTVKGGGLIIDVNHGSDASRVAGYNVTFETLDQTTSGVTGGITSQSLLAGDGTVFLAADEQITLSGFDGSLKAVFAPGTITAATDINDFTSTIGSFTVDAGNSAAGVTFGDNSTYLAQLGSGGASDLIEILNGSLTIIGSASLVLDGTLEDGQVYTLAEYTSITGTFASVTGLDEGWGLNYGVNELTLSQIPEPAAFVSLMGFAVLSFVGMRRPRTIA